MTPIYRFEAVVDVHVPDSAIRALNLYHDGVEYVPLEEDPSEELLEAT